MGGKKSGNSREDVPPLPDVVPQVSAGQTEQCDLVVVGMGICGCAAAITATDLGAKVILLDKLGKEGMDARVALGVKRIFGNDTSRSGGFCHPNSHQFGYDIGKMVEAIMALPGMKLPAADISESIGNFPPGHPGHRLSRDLLIAIAEVNMGQSKNPAYRQLDSADFWKAVVGDKIEVSTGISKMGQQSKSCRAVSPDRSGPSLMWAILEAAEKYGVKMAFKSRATRLLVDKLGRVAGVRALGPTGIIDYRAKAAILASGGFQGNQAMLHQYVGPSISHGAILLTGSPFNTGDGHRMAMEVGALLANPALCHMRNTTPGWDTGFINISGELGRYSIIVNTEGKRFINENIMKDDIANAIAYQPNQVAGLVWDDAMVKKFQDDYKRTLNWGNHAKYMRDCHRLEEVAEYIGCPAEALKRTITEYNQAIRDETITTLPIKKTGCAVPLNKAPWHVCFPIVPGLNHTLGGLEVNSRCAVLDEMADPIPGLYAGGALTNWNWGYVWTGAGVTSFVGSYDLSSSGLSTCTAMGRIAGVEALKTTSRGWQQG
ncbi:MAG: FAD-binding protein [Thermodesulfobacteriota bacterium]